jgi:hypothetical protein
VTVECDNAPPQRAGVDEVRATVELLAREHPGATEDELARLLADHLHEDRDLLQFVCCRLVRTVAKARHHVEHASLTPKRDPAKRQAEARAVAARIKAEIVLDMLMPNGLKLRFCSGAEVAAFGSAFTRIAQMVGADQLVGEVLIESEARALLAGVGA